MLKCTYNVKTLRRSITINTDNRANNDVPLSFCRRAQLCYIIRVTNKDCPTAKLATGLSTRVPECQKIKKGELDQYGVERLGRLILPQSEKVWD